MAQINALQTVQIIDVELPIHILAVRPMVDTENMVTVRGLMVFPLM